MVKFEAWIRLYGPLFLLACGLVSDFIRGASLILCLFEILVLFVWYRRHQRTVLSLGDHLSLGIVLFVLNLLFRKFDPIFLITELGSKLVLVLALWWRLPVRRIVRKAFKQLPGIETPATLWVNRFGVGILSSNRKQVLIPGSLTTSEVRWCTYRLCLLSPGSPVMIEDYRDPDDGEHGKQFLLSCH